MISIIPRVFDRVGIARELLAFFWARKVWWMIPVIIMILVLAILLTFAQGAAVVPFVYTLF